MEPKLQIHHKENDYLIPKDEASIVMTFIDNSTDFIEGFVLSYDQLFTAIKEFKEREKSKYLSHKDKGNS